ncbi:hypothetical protein KC315_g5752 [Hortaea werneckii]|nr:hypothetical protein KC315_g5752 [Hortaea werneckii]
MKMDIPKQSKQWKKDALKHFEERDQALMGEEESVLEENDESLQAHAAVSQPLSVHNGKYSLPETQVNRQLASRNNAEQVQYVLKYLAEVAERNMAMDADEALADAITAAFSSILTVGERAEKSPEEERKRNDPDNVVGQLLESARAIINKHGIKNKSKAKSSSSTPAPGAKAASTPAAGADGAKNRGEKPKKQLMGQKLSG